MQHQEWFLRFNEFDEAVANGKQRDVVFDTLAFLLRYSIEHFALEEATMARCHCPMLRTNIIAHERFRAHLDEILRQIEQTGPLLVDVTAIQQELEQWLTNHMCKIDLRLRDCPSS